MPRKRIVKICSPFFYPTRRFETSLNKLCAALIEDEDIDFKMDRDVHRPGPFPWTYWSRGACLGVEPWDELDVIPWHGAEDYDDILWLDNDMEFEPWMAYRLLNSDKPIVCGIYPMGDKREFCAAVWDKESDEVKTLIGIGFDEVEEKTPLAGGIVWTGMGFFKTKKGVFEKTERPWFDHLYLPTAGGKGRGMAMMPEDISCTHRMGKAGFEILVDMFVSKYLGHEKSKVYQGIHNSTLTDLLNDTPEIAGPTTDHFEDTKKYIERLPDKLVMDMPKVNVDV